MDDFQRSVGLGPSTMEDDGNGDALVQAISDSILRAMPGSVTTEKARSIAEYLCIKGLKNQEQLIYVQEEDLVDYLTRFEARQLIVAWKGGEGSGSNGRSTIFTEDVIYFTMDGHLLGTATGLIEGIQTLFASYFVFNLDYAAEAQITLEFIQRIIADMNPARGNKRPTRAAGGKASSRSIHHTLAQMNEKYDEYFAEQSDSEDGSESEMEH